MIRAAEGGVDWRYIGDDRFEVPIEEAARLINRAAAILAECREFVAGLDAILHRYRHTNLFLTDEGGTIETMVRRHAESDPMQRLYDLDHIDDNQLRHSREIGQIVRHVTIGSGVRVMRLPVASGIDPEDKRDRHERASDIAEAAAWISLLHHNVYRPWAEARPKTMPLILGLIVEGNSLQALRRRHRMRWATALQVVKDALDGYALVRSGYVSRGVQPTPQIRPRRAVPVEL